MLHVSWHFVSHYVLALCRSIMFSAGTLSPAIITALLHCSSGNCEVREVSCGAGLSCITLHSKYIFNNVHRPIYVHLEHFLSKKSAEQVNGPQLMQISAILLENVHIKWLSMLPCKHLFYTNFFSRVYSWAERFHCGLYDLLHISGYSFPES